MGIHEFDVRKLNRRLQKLLMETPVVTVNNDQWQALLVAARAGRDTLDSLRRGAKFSPAMLEAGYEQLRQALQPFELEQSEEG